MRSSARYRQIWIKGAERPCDHDNEDEVLTEGGDVIAWRCKACQLVVATYGPCAGCNTEKRLAHLVASRRRWWCSQDCHQQTLKREREARAGT